jgi:hypothetical protein
MEWLLRIISASVTPSSSVLFATPIVIFGLFGKTHIPGNEENIPTPDLPTMKVFVIEQKFIVNIFLN